MFSLANQSITICSFYLDSFLSWTKEDIEIFLKKDNTKLNIIISNPDTNNNLVLISRLFPQYKEEVVKNKINGTETKIIKILENIKVSTSKFSLYKYNYLLNYSYILIDDKYLYLTIYEMERGRKKIPHA